MPILFIFILFSSLLSAAQVERKSPPPKQADSVIANPDQLATNKTTRKDILKELDLTREQRLKIKEIRNGNLAKKTAIENDSLLTDKEKKLRLREIQKIQAEKLQSILTAEQKEKFRRLAANRKEDWN